MSNKTRKRICPGALVLSIAIVGVLVAFVLLAGNPATTDAHGGGPAGSHCTGESDAFKNAHDALQPASHPKCADDVTPTPPPTISPTPDTSSDAFSTGSTSGGSSIEVKVTIGSLPMDAEAGGSVEVYLEDDFQVPDSIDRDTV